MDTPAGITRRTFLAWTGLAATTTLVAACSPAAPALSAATAIRPSGAGGGGAVTSAAAAPTSAGEPRSGGTLRFAQAVEIAGGNGPSALDGHNISAAPLSSTWLGY